VRESVREREAYWAHQDEVIVETSVTKWLRETGRLATEEQEQALKTEAAFKPREKPKYRGGGWKSGAEFDQQ
jgi:hypothetical protein